VEHNYRTVLPAGDLARELGKWDDVEECFSRAAEYYNGEGRQTAAADALAKGARILEEKRPEVGPISSRKGCIDFGKTLSLFEGLHLLRAKVACCTTGRAAPACCLLNAW
jgi:hypothetical protein